MTTLRGDVYAMHVNFLNFDVPFSLGGGRPNIYTKLKCLALIKHSDLHTLLILICNCENINEKHFIKFVIENFWIFSKRKYFNLFIIFLINMVCVYIDTVHGIWI